MITMNGLKIGHYFVVLGVKSILAVTLDSLGENVAILVVVLLVPLSFSIMLELFGNGI